MILEIVVFINVFRTIITFISQLLKKNLLKNIKHRKLISFRVVALSAYKNNYCMNSFEGYVINQI